MLLPGSRQFLLSGSRPRASRTGASLVLNTSSWSCGLEVPARPGRNGEDVARSEVEPSARRARRRRCRRNTVATREPVCRLRTLRPPARTRCASQRMVGITSRAAGRVDEGHRRGGSTRRLQASAQCPVGIGPAVGQQRASAPAGPLPRRGQQPGGAVVAFRLRLRRGAASTSSVGPSSKNTASRAATMGRSSTSIHSIGRSPELWCSWKFQLGVRMRSPADMASGSPSTRVQTPEPSSTKRRAAGVCRCAGADLVGAEVLHRRPQRRHRVRCPVQTRVGAGQHPPVAAAIDRDQMAGALAQALQFLGRPPERHRPHRRRRGEQAPQLPQRLQLLLVEVPVQQIRGPDRTR